MLIEQLMSELGVTHDQILSDLAERGITQEWMEAKGHEPLVTWARGYYRQTTTDIARGKAEYESLPRTRTRHGRRGSPLQAFMTRIMSQSDGLMRPHHFLSEMEGVLRRLHMDDPHIYTQYRPDNPVRTGAREQHKPHWAIWRWRYHLARHEDHGNRRGMPNKDVDKLSVDEIKAIAHERSDVEGWQPWNRQHTHIPASRFLNVPAPKRDLVRRHDHATAFHGKPKLLESHLKKYHPGGDVLGSHDWIEKDVKDERYEYAKRIDVNPLISERMLIECEVLVFLIEGAQKADSALSQILRDDGLLCGRRAAVISAPAVGQWEARELPEIMSRYGQGKIVLVFADSDAYENHDVMSQANLCCASAESLGAAKACVVLPEESRGPGVKVGLDDSLGEDRRRLEDCVVLRREVMDWDRYYQTIFLGHPTRDRQSLMEGTYESGRRAAASVAWNMASYCNEDGEIFATQRMRARQLDWRDHKRIGRADEKLADWEWISVVEGSLETREDDYSYHDVYTNTPVIRLHELLLPMLWKQTLKEFLTERDKEGKGMANTEAPTAVERIARLESRVAEHDHQLGLVDDEHAANAVDQFIRSIGDEDAA